MNTKFLEADLTQLDQHALEKIAQIAAQARRSLLLGIATIRHMDDPPQPLHADADSDQMVEQLSRLTLMWDEIHHRASLLLTDTPPQQPADQRQAFKHAPPVTLH
ncbi:MAG: hypothetical protein HQM02_05515 [Magnetococcales bacterium]|nr:hypothetical protein [Magnetococcales bacterium]